MAECKDCGHEVSATIRCRCLACSGVRIATLENELSQAISYLKEGKQKYAPDTTNSLVDEFLKKHTVESSP